MKMNIKIYLTAVVVMFIGSFSVPVVFVSAQTNGQDLQVVILQLQEQIKTLQAQIDQLKSELTTTKSELEGVKAELKFTKTLRLGATGDEVRELQAFLRQHPDIYPEGLVTGYFGPLTEAAVKRLQEKNDIESVGIVGPQTRAKLNELITEGAGVSGITPPGLLIAPGLERGGRVASTTQATTTIQIAPSTLTSTPSGTVPAIPAEPAVPISTSGTATTPAVPATPATPVVHARYAITATAGTGGTISPSGTVSVISGGSQTFVIAPGAGYQIASVTVDGVNQGAISSYSFTNVTVAHTISVSFSPIQLPFSDNFNDGNTDGWTAAMPLSVYSREPATWRVENQQVVNTPLLTSGDNYKFLLDNYSLSSSSAEAKVLFYGSGYGGLTIWHYDLDNWVDVVGYPAGLGKDGKPLMIIQAINGFVTTTKYPYIWWTTGNGEGAWTDMKVIANGDTGVIDVYANGQHAITHQTQVIHRNGLSGFNSGNGGGAFDDFKLDSSASASASQ